MNKGEFINRLLKKKWIVFLIGVVFAAIFYTSAKLVPAKYTSRATLFPLSSSSGSSGGGASALSGLLGGGGTGGNFSGDASLNILELALSRTIRENVAATRIPTLGNKTISELLVDEYNKHVFMHSNQLGLPKDSVGAAVVGGGMLAGAMLAKVNKNGVLELNFTSTDPALVKPISETIIDVLSHFYINLRIQKALTDYKFVLKKVDSLKGTMQTIDSKAIDIQNSTYFTPNGKLEYQLPQDNLTLEKQRATSQENSEISYRENALWTLQKATPIVAVLDHPNPPFDVDKPSAKVSAITGFVIGLIVGVIVVLYKLLYIFIKQETKKLIES